MAAAFSMAGFEPWDVNMQDLMDGRVTLDNFRGVAFVGGFSYADVCGSAKGEFSWRQFCWVCVVPGQLSRLNGLLMTRWLFVVKYSDVHRIQYIYMVSTFFCLFVVKHSVLNCPSLHFSSLLINKGYNSLSQPNEDCMYLKSDLTLESECVPICILLIFI